MRLGLRLGLRLGPSRGEAGPEGAGSRSACWGANKPGNDVELEAGTRAGAVAGPEGRVRIPGVRLGLGRDLAGTADGWRRDRAGTETGPSRGRSRGRGRDEVGTEDGLEIETETGLSRAGTATSSTSLPGLDPGLGPPPRPRLGPGHQLNITPGLDPALGPPPRSNFSPGSRPRSHVEPSSFPTASPPCSPTSVPASAPASPANSLVHRVAPSPLRPLSPPPVLPGA